MVDQCPWPFGECECLRSGDIRHARPSTCALDRGGWCSDSMTYELNIVQTGGVELTFPKQLASMLLGAESGTVFYGTDNEVVALFIPFPTVCEHPQGEIDG